MTGRGPGAGGPGRGAPSGGRGPGPRGRRDGQGGAPGQRRPGDEPPAPPRDPRTATGPNARLPPDRSTGPIPRLPRNSYQPFIGALDRLPASETVHLPKKKDGSGINGYPVFLAINEAQKFKSEELREALKNWANTFSASSGVTSAASPAAIFCSR